MAIKSITAILTLFIYSNFSYTINDRGHHQIAESESVLDPKGEILLKWRVNYSTRKIKFRVSISENGPSFNWFALGFSDRGKFNNSDICLFWTDYKGNYNFKDMYADDDGRLYSDFQQNCDNFFYDVDTQSLIFERFFDTCDSDDYVIEDGTVHVIWAHGNDKLYSSEGLSLLSSPSEYHGFIRVRLLTPISRPKDKSAYQFRITNKNLKVPSDDTTYWCKVFKLPEFISNKTHHIIQVKAAWAMGAPPFIYPKEAGVPLGGPNANKYVILEVHYNNPELRNDWVDSSGLVLHITGKRRKFDASIMEIGMQYTDKIAIPGRQKAFQLTASCIPQCTQVGLPSDGIVVFGSQLHTHLTGIAVWTRHSRQGVELPYLNKDMHYSTHFQEIRILHRPVKVLPGDYLETICIYNTEDKDNATFGGIATSDEMCINYLHYYPAVNLEKCESVITDAAVENYFKFEERYDNMSISYEASYRQKYLSIKPWTHERAQRLQALYRESPINLYCHKTDGSLFPGDWEDILIPKIQVPLPVEDRVCPDM